MEKYAGYRGYAFNNEKQFNKNRFIYESKQQNMAETNKKVEEIKKKYASKNYNSIIPVKPTEKENLNQFTTKCYQQYQSNFYPSENLSSTERHMAQPTPRLGVISQNEEKLYLRMKQMKQMLNNKTYNYEQQSKKQEFYKQDKYTQLMSTEQLKTNKQSNRSENIYESKIENLDNITNKIKLMMVHKNYREKEHHQIVETNKSFKESFRKDIVLQNNYNRQTGMKKQSSSINFQFRPQFEKHQFAFHDQPSHKQKLYSDNSPFVSPSFRNFNESIKLDLQNRKEINKREPIQITPIKNTNSLEKIRNKISMYEQSSKVNKSHKVTFTQRENEKQKQWQKNKQIGSLEAGKYQKSGRNVQEQIKNIENKIRMFQEEKKRLNIINKPYDYNKAMKYSMHTQNTQKKKNDTSLSFCFEQNKQKQRVNVQNNYQKSSYTGFTDKPPLPKDKSNDIQQKITSYKPKRQFKIELIPIQTDPQFQAAPSIRNSQTINSKDTTKTNNFESTYQEKNNKFQQMNKKGSTKISKKLIQRFCEQVKLDEKVRNCKIWLTAQKEDDGKWEKLSKELKYNSIYLSIPEIQKIFTATQEQNNPFYTKSESNETYESIAEDYARAEKYWQRQLIRKFNKQQLSYSSFFVQKIDLQGKGYFVLEDLVRLLNMETGTFYRNRDLLLIYRRMIKEGTKGSYDELIKTLCY